MPSIKPFGLALLVLGLSACASLGQSGNRDNEVKVAAQKLIGQPAGKAFELFGGSCRDKGKIHSFGM
ncbi:hypothetical protein FA335_17695 [Pseudomonas aeruginosa]|nr:hypothetical protein Q077_03193 [Pseudomonas aeruginosa BL23]MBG5540919.1 hypothetical protein [Pseudomonas aeruginosa]MCO2510694.1 hypothetical protein [Pseudomonas aeruginosa]NQC49088.1 hypothetical protein [Pseudomonas aeruginosa]PTZ67039.1 hypothetical protein DB392_17300 [Pseudomonas aeruginosa]